MVTGSVHVGLDVGSTRTKAVAYDGAGRPVAEHHVATPWTTSAQGRTETSGAALLAGALAAVHGLLPRLGDPSRRVASLGVTGMAESGVLLDATGAESAPVVAWYDPRGAEEMAALPGCVAAAFTATTGLRADAQPSAATLAWGLRHGWRVTPASTWLTVPEHVVAALGGDRVAEPSLASRTGLLDTTRLVPADDLADALGLPRTLLPPLRRAGTSAGRVTLADADPRLRGAVLTVAGHDHPVGAVGAGATGAAHLFNGAGTADVLLRSAAGPVAAADRARLAAAGVSVGAHVLEDLSAVVGGVSAGVVLRRVLSLVGAVDGARRDAVDAAAALVPRPVPGVTVRAGGRGGDDVQVVVTREAEPAELLAAALHHVGEQTSALVDLMTSAVGPHTAALCVGGWTRMASVRALKQDVLPGVELADVALPGCRGAAALGALAAMGAHDQHDLTDLLAAWGTPLPAGVRPPHPAPSGGAL
ncbi:FGGY family carbohydrate kinase [Pseudokineococcus lusitanus]|uniref:Sugar (Pentulose or hexulose) kinase n=2 Tax=Actinomycetes TaxID=1760 RepID=A0A3N1HQQ7_9ACTN|nr:FGGY family carbohydrate kinase [Pseudokineococcus lusitanus]ROP44722.1 sugar (pentulose or hexulose) kinase [Pseudokineococcus lusitanus]